MAHALDNASHTSACAELGIAVGNDRDQSTLTRHATMNKWSFYRSGAISANITTKLMELTAPSSDDKLGDFRGYTHNAITPTIPSDYDRYYGPGGTEFDITFAIYTEQWNLRETSSGSIPYIIIKYYPTSTDRTNGTNLIRTLSTLVSETPVTPPTGHTNNQTAKQASASQIIVDTFQVSDIPVSNILYCDVYIGNNGGSTVYGRFGAVTADGHVDISIYENQNPTLTGGANYTPPPGTFTAIWPAIGSASTPKCDDLTIDQSNGQTTYSFYLNMVGIDGVTQKTRRVTSCTVSLKVGGSSAVIATGQALGWTSKTLISGTIPGGLSGGNFSYNEVWTVEVSSVTFGANESTC